MENKSKGMCNTQSRILQSFYTAYSRPTASDSSKAAHVHQTQESDRDRTSTKSYVTGAPVTRYRMDKSIYIMRTPLWPEPIVGNYSTHENSRWRHMCYEEDSLKLKGKETPQSIKNSLFGTVSPPLSRRDLDISRRLLNLRLCDDEELTMGPRRTSTPQSTARFSPSPFPRYVKSGTFGASSKVHCPKPNNMSSYQANYWACAIPRSMPPFPDRTSPSWDPAKEYQEILNYTYPLRPDMNTTFLSQSDLLLPSDPVSHDSGIELDHFCDSSPLSCLDFSLAGTRDFGLLNPSKSSDVKLPGPHCSIDSGKNLGHYRNFGIFSKSVPAFISSTHVLPRSDTLGEWDEEFLRLPDYLHELQVLSEQLRNIHNQIYQTVNWDSQDTSVRPPMEVPTGRQELVIDTEDEELAEKSRYDVPFHYRSNLREVESLMDQLSGRSTSELRRTIQTDTKAAGSLMQCIQAFCSNLEKLIQWLHKVVEKIDVLSPPKVDLESVKTSLAEYKNFQQDIQAHKLLTEDVLETGKVLLNCLTTMSPFLKETLVLIERQSRSLESHADHLFSTILSAMDCLTEPRIEEGSGK